MVEALLGTLRVEDPEFRVDELGPGPASISTGRRWALVALARGRISLDVTLGPGDAVLTRRHPALAGQAGDEGATVLVAEFALRGAADRLISLPDHLVVRADSEMCRLLIKRLTDRFDAAPANDAVSARLLDWLVASTVRDVFVEAAQSGPVSDPGVAAALAAIHGHPGEPWTVVRLARHAHVGRAAFARRFRDAVGTSPLSYVREHRLDLAERALITEPDTTIAAIARRVGYANPFSFSTAFRRHRGLAPSEIRNPHTTTGPGSTPSRGAIGDRGEEQPAGRARG